MAKVMIQIEDTETGSVTVKWKSDSGYLVSDGTDAEQIALLLLKMLAEAGDVDIEDMMVPVAKVNN